MLYNRLTVVIPCKNEQDYIGHLLGDLASQLFIDRTKVYIADANSTDNTLFVIENAKKLYPQLNIEVIEGGKVSVGRNNGAKLATTPYICFIDADVRLFSDDILIKSSLRMSEGYDLLTCNIKSYSLSLLSKLSYWVYNYVIKLMKFKYPFAIGAYFFVDRQKFIEYGMFSTSTDTSEDFLFSQNFTPRQFKVLDRFIGQDDRRFKKMGYLGMFKYLVVNFYKFLKKDINHFSKDVGYWN